MYWQVAVALRQDTWLTILRFRIQIPPLVSKADEQTYLFTNIEISQLTDNALIPATSIKLFTRLAPEQAMFHQKDALASGSSTVVEHSTHNPKI